MNSLVLLMWRVPSLNRIMTRWFTSSIASSMSLRSLFRSVKRSLLIGSSTPLLLSCFSHADVWHFALNMYVLWSFSAAFQSRLFLTCLAKQICGCRLDEPRGIFGYVRDRR